MELSCRVASARCDWLAPDAQSNVGDLALEARGHDSRTTPPFGRSRARDLELELHLFGWEDAHVTTVAT